MDDGFIGPGVAEFFPREALDSFWVVGKRVNLGLKLRGTGLFDLNLPLQFEDLPLHPLIFPDDRQITQSHQQQDRHHHQEDDNFGELAPKAEVNIHPAS